MEECKVYGCSKPKKHLNMCGVHYGRQYRGKNLHQDTGYDDRSAIIIGKYALIPIGIGAKDGFALVDREFAFIADQYKFTAKYVRGGYYAVSDHDYLHSLIAGKISGFDLDHINRNKLDNRLENFRFVTHQQNVINQSLTKHNKSGYRGVSIKRYRKDGTPVYRAVLKSGKTQYTSGKLHDTAEEAALAYNKLAVQHFGEFAVLNDIEKKYKDKLEELKASDKRLSLL